MIEWLLSGTPPAVSASMKIAHTSGWLPAQGKVGQGGVVQSTFQASAISKPVRPAGKCSRGALAGVTA
jgi:hypothetical protein